MKFLLPGLFLLALGVGNVLVGLYKGDEYEQVLVELSVLEPTQGLVNASPMRRIEIAKQTADRLYQRQTHARARRDFYRLVAFGGKVFISVSFILLLSSGMLQYIQRTNN